MPLSRRFHSVVGWVGTFTGVCMYLSYIDQIVLNMHGHPGSTIQPLATIVNCSLWTLYGYFRPDKRDWPIVMANSPGILLGAISLLTALYARTM